MPSCTNVNDLVAAWALRHWQTIHHNQPTKSKGAKIMDDLDMSRSQRKFDAGFKLQNFSKPFYVPQYRNKL